MVYFVAHKLHFGETVKALALVLLIPFSSEKSFPLEGDGEVAQWVKLSLDL